MPAGVAIFFVLWFAFGAVWTGYKWRVNGGFDGPIDACVLVFCGAAMGGFAVFYWWLYFDFGH